MQKRQGPRGAVGFVAGTAEPGGRTRTRTGYAGDVAEWAVDGRTDPDGRKAAESDAEAL